MAEREYLLVFAAITLAVALFAPALGGGYLWDDVDLIRDNPLIRGFAHWKLWFSRGLFDTHLDQILAIPRAQYFRPLVLFTFALDFQLGGLNPAVGHATNLLLWGGCLVLVYAALRRWLDHAALALLGLLWFALHPTRAESVAWVSGRSDLLLTIGLLLAAWGFRRRLTTGRARFCLIEILGTAIAYGSKEAAIVLPAFYVIEAWLEQGRPALGLSVVTTMLRRALPQVLVTSLYLGVRLTWMPFHVGNTASISLFERLTLFFETIGHASAMTLWPWPQLGQHGLTAISPAGKLLHAPGYIALGAVTLTVVLVVALRAAKRHPAVSMALLVALGLFLPAANLAPHRLQCLFFERYLFLPHLGCAWLCALLVGRVTDARNHWRTPIVSAALLAVGAGYGYLAHQRTLDYADSERFWTHELRHNPTSTVAPVSLAYLHSAELEPERRLRLLLTCAQNAGARRLVAESDRCVVDALTLVGTRTYDADTATLRGIAREFQLLLEGKSDSLKRPVLRNRVGAFQLLLTPERAKQLMVAQPGMVEEHLALLHSRLGENRLAVKYATASLARCKDCSWTPRLATVFAAADDYDGAWRILPPVARRLGQSATLSIAEQVSASESAARRSRVTTGPAQLHARAERFLALGHYGQAYLLLAPEKEAFLPVRDVALGFAKIACRAGYEAEARLALERHLSPTDAAAVLSQWSTAEWMIR